MPAVEREKYFIIEHQSRGNPHTHCLFHLYDPGSKVNFLNKENCTVRNVLVGKNSAWSFRKK